MRIATRVFPVSVAGSLVIGIATRVSAVCIAAILVVGTAARVSAVGVAAVDSSLSESSLLGPDGS